MKTTLKYIIWDGSFPTLFGEYFKHNQVRVAGEADAPTSAGFVDLTTNENGVTTVRCYGESTSMSLKSEPRDEILIARLFNN